MEVKPITQNQGMRAPIADETMLRIVFAICPDSMRAIVDRGSV
jgi:hypothetical protein